ncbi:MAG: hypothetical protein E4H03_05955 [Myxococcales bacterium]|nr:MAG: hypothetical protein E4H03_05955 [Myxococcales bacterium]
MGLLDVFSRFLEDGSTDLTWDQMTNGERAVSAVDPGDLLWSGELVTAASGVLTSGTVGAKVRMYAPDPVQPGSSVSHFDTAVASGSADELMEPFATGDETFLVTEELLADIGWRLLCGNGAVDGGEQCDDDNTVGGDGCSILCQVEPCHSCDASEPSSCTPETGTPCEDGVSCTTESCSAGVCTSDATECALDHFKLYKARSANGSVKFSAREVSLLDEFEDKMTLVAKPERVGNPADKNGEGISIPEAHLVCYKIKDAKTDPAQLRFVRRSVQMMNPFGTEDLDVLKPTALRVPAATGGSFAPEAPASGVLDHFKCYKAKPSKGGTKFEPRTVTLVDGFENKETVALKPAEICNPVDREGEGVIDPAGHLECYRIKDAKTDPRQPKFSGADVFATNPFGSEILRATKPDRLCVPSTRQDL